MITNFENVLDLFLNFNLQRPEGSVTANQCAFIPCCNCGAFNWISRLLALHSFALYFPCLLVPHLLGGLHKRLLSMPRASKERPSDESEVWLDTPCVNVNCHHVFSKKIDFSQHLQQTEHWKFVLRDSGKMARYFCKKLKYNAGMAWEELIQYSAQCE